MKSYTDIEQSKKLAEILSNESADMYYPNSTVVKYQGALPIEFKHGNPLLSQEIAAWSLTALLSVLNCPELTQVSNGSWFIRSWYKHHPYAIPGVNPVDICYELIVWLKENGKICISLTLHVLLLLAFTLIHLMNLSLI